MFTDRDRKQGRGTSLNLHKELLLCYHGWGLEHGYQRVHAKRLKEYTTIIGNGIRFYGERIGIPL